MPEGMSLLSPDINLYRKTKPNIIPVKSKQIQSIKLGLVRLNVFFYTQIFYICISQDEQV